MESYEALLKKKYLYEAFEESIRKNLALHLQLWSLRSGFSKLKVLSFLQEVKRSPKNALLYLSQTFLRVATAQVRGLSHLPTARLLIKIARIS
jgi:hypothetical protein